MCWLLHCTPRTTSSSLLTSTWFLTHHIPLHMSLFDVIYARFLPLNSYHILMLTVLLTLSVPLWCLVLLLSKGEKTFSSLLCPPPPPPSSTLTADDFATFFIDKITNLTAQFPTPQSVKHILSENKSLFTYFSPLSEAEVSKLYHCYADDTQLYLSFILMIWR